MPGDAQLSEPAASLLAAARVSVPVWLRRVIGDACRRGGVDPASVADELDRTVDEVAAATLERLGALLATDVDHQRTTPLSVFRDAVASAPSEFLRVHGVAPPARPGDGHPDDVYALGPAAWTDVDPTLHELGLTWGAWKAMTILTRRRDEGLR